MQQEGDCDCRFTSEFRTNCSRGGGRSPRPLLEFDSNDVNCQFRKMRNLSEKKRRDQFNLLINELCSMVSTTARKMDKSSVLKSTIAFLRQHNEQETEIALSTEARQQVQEDWKPPFLSNEEFAHLMLEALDGFIIAFATNGRISYVSESIASLLGYLPNEVLNMTIYDLVHEDSRSELYEVLNSHSSNVLLDSASESQISLVLYMKRGPLDVNETADHELVRFVGSYVQWNCHDDGGTYVDVLQSDGSDGQFVCSYTGVDRMQPGEFVATVTLQSPHLLREMTLCDGDVAKSEFTSRHSLEWKFLYLDHRAPPIIGYLPFEVLGTSGYDYYHVDDLERIVVCHEALMQTGEGTCSYYRFLTKGQQWIWLQTRYYITYHQWNSKPEFIVCTHIVVSCAEARSQLRKETPRQDNPNSFRVTSLTQPVRNQSFGNTMPQPPDARNQPTGETRTMHRRQEQNVGSTAVSKNTSLNMTDENLASGGSPSTKVHSSLVCHSRCQNASIQLETANQSGERAPFGKLAIMTPPMGQFPIHQSSIPTTQPLCHECQAIGNPVVVDAVIASSVQQHDDLQEQLICKHHILQEQILHQQEELQRIHEQLMFAQFAPQTSATTSSASANQMQYSENAFQQTTIGLPMDANSSSVSTVSVSSLENQETIQYQLSQQGVDMSGRMEFGDTHNDGQLDKRL